ncbi:unnamed protein product [Knipowitschia caucasica]
MAAEGVWTGEMSGSDVEGSVREAGAGNESDTDGVKVWQNQKKKRKRKKENQGTSQSEATDHSEEEVEEFKVVLTLVEEGASFGKWNPIHLTREVDRVIGTVKYAKTLRNGSLLIICMNAEDRKKALKLTRIVGQEVKARVLEDKQVVSGVISGIPPSVPVEDIKSRLKGTNAKIVDIKRLKAWRNGERSDSFSVMVKFEGKVLPDKVFIDFMCYKCQGIYPSTTSML